MTSGLILDELDDEAQKFYNRLAYKAHAELNSIRLGLGMGRIQFKEMDMSKCACGCGQEISAGAAKKGWMYARGHKPKAAIREKSNRIVVPRDAAKAISEHQTGEGRNVASDRFEITVDFEPMKAYLVAARSRLMTQLDAINKAYDAVKGL